MQLCATRQVLAGKTLMLFLNNFKALKLASCHLLFYLDIPVSLIENHLDKLRVLESIQKVGIETVEVGLNANALHHQVLRHPRHKLLLHRLFQLLNLKKANVIFKKFL